MSEARRQHLARDLIIALVVFMAVAFAVLAVWGGGVRVPNSESAPTRSETSSAPEGTNPAQEGTGSEPGGPAPPQPAPNGYVYTLTVERYVVPAQNGEMEVQQQRRESWRADDGWAWARQTGDDPGRFIFKPDTEWKLIRNAQPQAAEMKQIMQEKMGGVPPSEVDQAEFNFVVDLLGVETLPVGSLPKDYRRALVDALSRNGDVTVTHHASDPRGRKSTRITLRDADRPDVVTRSLYLDQQNRYLANQTEVSGSDEQGSRIVIARRQAEQIPKDLLNVLGSDRVEKAMWD